MIILYSKNYLSVDFSFRIMSWHKTRMHKIKAIDAKSNNIIAFKAKKKQKKQTHKSFLSFFSFPTMMKIKVE